MRHSHSRGGKIYLLKSGKEEGGLKIIARHCFKYMINFFRSIFFRSTTASVFLKHLKLKKLDNLD